MLVLKVGDPLAVRVSPNPLASGNVVTVALSERDSESAFHHPANCADVTRAGTDEPLPSSARQYTICVVPAEPPEVLIATVRFVASTDVRDTISPANDPVILTCNGMPLSPWAMVPPSPTDATPVLLDT